MSQAQLDAILAKGRRKWDAAPLLQEYSDHVRAVRSAFDEGMRAGSRGCAPADAVKHAWDNSRALADVRRSTGHRNIVGLGVTTDDDLGGVLWRIVAAHHGLVWIRHGEANRLVDGEAVREVAG